MNHQNQDDPSSYKYPFTLLRGERFIFGLKGFAHELNAEDLVWVKTQTTSVPSPAHTRIELEPLIYQRRSEAGLLHMRMYLIGSP